MEDLPTLQGPKNKTMGLEVISPSAVFVCERERETEREGLREKEQGEKMAALDKKVPFLLGCYIELQQYLALYC